MRKISPLLKTVIIVFLILSITSIVYTFANLILGSKILFGKFLVDNITFSAMQGIITMSLILGLYSEMNKKETSDKHLRLDIFKRLKHVEDEMATIKAELELLKSKPNTPIEENEES